MPKSSNSRALSIIKQLGGNISTGMCKCPAHEDKNPSLHVSVGDKQAVIIKCHAGCTQDQVISALKSRNMWPEKGWSVNKCTPLPKLDEAADEFERFRRALAILRRAAGAVGDCRNPPTPQKPTKYLNARSITLENENLYLDRDGMPQLVAPVVHAEKGLVGAYVVNLDKSASSKRRMREGRPERLYGPIGGGYVPCGDASPEKPLIVAEGLETAMSAAQIAILPAIASLSASNMERVKLPPCSEVIIAADDDKAGRNAAKALARRLKLENPNRPVRIAIPENPKQQKGYDWNDVLRDPDFDAPHARKQIVRAKAINGGDELALGVKDFLSLNFPPQDHLLKPILTTASINMLVAQRGCCKSLLAMGMAYAASRRQDFMKWICERRARVLYVDGELQGRLLQKRLSLFGESPPSAYLRFLNRDRMVKIKGSTLDLSQEEDRELLDRIIERYEIDFIVLDSILTLFSADTQKDFANWLPVQDWAYRHRDAGRTILYIHHESRKGNPFGISGREIPLDVIMRLERSDKFPSSDNESAFKLTFTKHRDFYGADAAPLIIKLSEPAGAYVWKHETEAANSRDRVKELLAQKWQQRDIAKELGISAGRVSQLVKEIRSERPH